MPVLRKSSLDASQLLLLVLAGGVIMGLALGVRHVQGLFLLPVTMDRGWSRETFAMALAVQNLTWGVVQPFTGMIADRYGSAKVIAGGLVFYALGLVGMAHATTPAGFLWTAGVCIGIALSGTAFAAIYGALSRLVA
ncbi:MFS transporter, partial [Achromobacter xylosoxidans]